MNKSNLRVLVLGGTGFIGSALCEALVRAGHQVTVPTRRAARAREVQHLPGLTVLEANVHNAPELAQLCAGQDVVVNLVAVLHGNVARFEHVHVALPQKTAAACTEQGVRRLVHMSALGVGADAPSNYLKSKTQGEAVLVAASQGAPWALALVRPSVVFGAGDKLLNLFAALQKSFPLMPLGHGDAQFQPVWVGDVVALLMAVVAGNFEGKNAKNRRGIREGSYENSSIIATPQALVVQACGPQVCTLADVVRTAGRVAGCERPILPLPAPLAWLQAAALEFLPGQLMSRDNVASLSKPNIAQAGVLGLADFGIAPSSMAAIAPTYVGGSGPREHLLHKRRKH